jgi:hypothetical protein
MTDPISRTSRFPHIRAFALILFVFLSQWLVLFSAQVPEWDGAYYYAIARSVAFDQDLHLENDLMAAYPYVNPPYRASHLDRLEEHRTITGRISAPFAIGISLLWVGWLVVLEPLTSMLLTLNGPVTGYEWPFIITVATFSALCGLMAFWLGYRLARKVVEEKWAIAAAITLMFTTPMLYYQFRDAFYSHTAGALTMGLVVYAWWHIRQRPLTWRAGVLMGGLIGLATLVRWQHLLYLTLPAISALWDWVLLPGPERGPAFKRLLGYGVAMGAAAFLVFFVQMVVWRLFYGSWVEVPQGDFYMVWVPLFWRSTLFSPYRGLFLWMPVALFSLIGLVDLSRQSPRTYIPILLMLVLEIYINSSTRDWFGGGGFGPRRFTSELVVLVLGYAGFLQLLGQQLSRWQVIHRLSGWLAAGLGMVLAWQQWILLRYGLVEKMGGRNLSMQPDYRWEETTLGEFARQIMNHVGDLWSRPQDFLIFAHSPVAIWQQAGQFPWHYLWVLIGVGVVMVAAARVIHLIWLHYSQDYP